MNKNSKTGCKNYQQKLINLSWFWKLVNRNLSAKFKCPINTSGEILTADFCLTYPVSVTGLRVSTDETVSLQSR